MSECATSQLVQSLSLERASLTLPISAEEGMTSSISSKRDNLQTVVTAAAFSNDWLREEATNHAALKCTTTIGEVKSKMAFALMALPRSTSLMKRGVRFVLN
jgi:hypothetical protein